MARALVLIVFTSGCYTHHVPPAMSKANERFPRTAMAFQRVRAGMEQGEVQVLLGPPDEVDYTFMPWSWLSFGFLPRSWTLAYHYRGLGVVTFSCSASHIAGSVSDIKPESRQ